MRPFSPGTLALLPAIALRITMLTVVRAYPAAAATKPTVKSWGMGLMAPPTRCRSVGMSEEERGLVEGRLPSLEGRGRL